MPCYLFTYHAFGSWMPDREQGFVRRRKGVLPSDEELARQYRRNAADSPLTFNAEPQLILIDEFLTASSHQRSRGHYIATELTHAHILVSWPDSRVWQKIRNSVKQSLTRRLNRQFDRRKWFSSGASRKRVRDQEHFEYLVGQYLPSHRGWKWQEGGEPFR